MTIVDWRQVDARALALVFARARATWLVELGWETRESWQQVEKARTTWGLPGLAAIDESRRVRGLTFFHPNGSRFELGGVFAETEAVRQALLDAALTVCEDADGEELRGFLFKGASPAPTALVARGFALDTVDYLACALRAREGEALPGLDAAVACRDWKDPDADHLAALLLASYDASEARRFVSDATEANWRQYVATLVRHTACGLVAARLTRMAWVNDLLVGAVLVTSLGPGTAHIAQVAVHPRWRRRGLAGGLVDEALGLSAAEGFTRMTLLVSSGNLTAQALYRDRGFEPCATFYSVAKTLAAGRAARAS